MFPGDFSNHFPYCFFDLVEVLILFIYSCQHFFFVSFIVLRAFALFCLYSMKFLVVGSFLNFLKAAFLCWIAFLHSALNQGLFFFVRDRVFGDTCFSYSDQSFYGFFLLWVVLSRVGGIFPSLLYLCSI